MGHRIGIVGLPGLASHLANAGFEVVSADGFAAAATTVRQAIQSGLRFPILVADVDDPSAPAAAAANWVAGASTTTDTLVVRLDTAAGFPTQNEVTTPITVEALLACVGLDGYTRGGTLSGADTVTVPAQPAPVKVETPTPHPSTSPGDTVLTEWAPRRGRHSAQPAPPTDTYKPASTTRAQTILSFAGKGGVGKTTAALMLAQHAAAHGPDGFRVTLIDGNRGQGDIRTYLGIYRAPLATVYDVVLTGEPGTALVTPAAIADHRRPDVEHIDFALAAAPPGDAAREVPASAYAAVIEHARSVSDLVVIDTQIMEEADNPMWDGIFIPLLMTGAWGMAVTGPSSPSLTNMIERVRTLRARGVPADSLLWFLNGADGNGQALADTAQKHVGIDARCMGVAAADPSVAALMSEGRLPTDNADLKRVVFSVLEQVTGHDEFAPVTAEPRRRGFLGRWR